jgi:hypothetical protein
LQQNIEPLKFRPLAVNTKFFQLHYIYEERERETGLLGVMPYTSEKAKRFGGTYRLYLQTLRIIQARNQQKQAASEASLGYCSTLKMEVL